MGLFNHVFRCRAYFCGERGAFWAIIVFHVALPNSIILLRLQNLHRGIDTCPYVGLPQVIPVYPKPRICAAVPLG